MGLKEKSIEQYQIALRIKPDYAIAHSNLGKTFLESGIIDKAIEHFEMAARLDPANVAFRRDLDNANKLRTEGR